jgi:protoporphyrinogen oxidase
MDESVSVAVVGSGIAGLTTALELAKRGYQVCVYEREETIGGNLSSQQIRGVYHDVYPHMFPSWYANFWRLVESDLGLSREGNFEKRSGAKALRKGDRDYIDLPNPTTLEAAWKTMTSGFVPMPDMFIYGYAMIDLAAQRFQADRLLNRYSLNGFLHSRAYATERAAEMLDLAVMEIWSIHGDLTSAAAYKDFVQRALALGTSLPFAWVLKGSLWERLIRPLVRKLAEYGCQIRTGHRVDTINVENAGVRLEIQTPGLESEHVWADYLVLAVEPTALGSLIQTGKDGYRLVDRLPDLSEVRRLRSEPIAVVDLYFKHELPNIPSEHVGLAGSKMALSFFQISGLWENDPKLRGRTALVLAASDFYALPLRNSLEDGHRMIEVFHEYLPIFKPGAYWGDPASDIDWEMSHFRPNLNNKLFINQVGSGEWSPNASYQALPNVFFAGDFCRNAVAMATVEGAVLSGLEAARALWSSHPKGPPVEILSHESRDERWLLATKLALSPTAYWAKWLSIAYDTVEPVSRGDLSVLPDAMVEMLSLPYAFGEEVLHTAYALANSLLTRPKR